MSQRKGFHPLPPPIDADSTEQSVEILRGWIVDGTLHVSLAHEAFGDRPEVWGQLLAESATHIADALSRGDRLEREHIFAAVRASLIEHLENPSPGLSGDVQSPVQ